MLEHKIGPVFKSYDEVKSTDAVIIGEAVERFGIPLSVLIIILVTPLVLAWLLLDYVVSFLLNVVSEYGTMIMVLNIVKEKKQTDEESSL